MGICRGQYTPFGSRRLRWVAILWRKIAVLGGRASRPNWRSKRRQAGRPRSQGRREEKNVHPLFAWKRTLALRNTGETQRRQDANNASEQLQRTAYSFFHARMARSLSFCFVGFDFRPRTSVCAGLAAMSWCPGNGSCKTVCSRFRQSAAVRDATATVFPEVSRSAVCVGVLYFSQSADMSWPSKAPDMTRPVSGSKKWR
jgi:hypothetical protein